MDRIKGIVLFPSLSLSKYGSPSGTSIGHSSTDYPVWKGVLSRSWVKNCPQATNREDRFRGSGSNYSSVESQTSLLMVRGEGLVTPLLSC